MQVNNEAGLSFYKSFGFEIAQEIENYYEDIEPRNCYLLRKQLVYGDEKKENVAESGQQ